MVGTNVDGYDGVYGGYGFGERNADGEWILEFCDAMELIVTNTCFKRQKKNKLATYVSGGTVSATDVRLLQEFFLQCSAHSLTVTYCACLITSDVLCSCRNDTIPDNCLWLYTAYRRYLQ